MVVEGHAVDENSAGRVGGVGREAAVVLFVELDREGFLGTAGNVVVYGWNEFGATKLGEDFLADRLEAQVDVVRVDGGGAGGMGVPQLRDGPGQEPQHAAHALEIVQGGDFGGEGFQNLGMEGVAGAKGRDGLGVRCIRGEEILIGEPERSVGFDGWQGLGGVNLAEQAAKENLNGFVVLGGIEERGLAGRDALRFGHFVGDELVLGAVGVARLALFANGEGVNEGNAGVAFDGFEQGGQEGAELLASGGSMKVAGFAQIDGEFVQKNKGRLAAEELGQRFRARSGVGLVTFADAIVTGLAGERIGQLASRGMGQDTIAHAAAVGRVGVLTVEGGNADFGLRDKLGVNELRDVGDAFHAVGGVVEGDQAVGLAAAVAGIEAEDGRGGAAVAGHASQHIAEEILEALGGVGVREEAIGLLVVVRGDVTDDLGQVGGKISVGNCALEDAS